MEKKPIYIYDDKKRAILVFAVTNGWLQDWMTQQQQSLESLYDREFGFLESVIEAVKSSYTLDTLYFLRNDFLQWFFKPFAKISISTFPEISSLSVSMPVSPNLIENQRYEEAWKFHAQQLVLLPEDKRVDYLFEFVPQIILEKIAEIAEAKRVKWNSVVKRRN